MTTPAEGNSANDPQTITVGVVADTHIPDRVNALHPMLLPTLHEARVQLILHAGDICVPGVLDALREVAPVKAVRGNRDLLAGPLPGVEQIEVGGVRLALMHGHGSLFTYLWDKWQFWLFGYQLKRYVNLLDRAGGNAQVVIFGHTHHPAVTTHAGKLIFNPGSASFGVHKGMPPSIGLLHIFPDGTYAAEIKPLEGYKIVKHRWVKKDTPGS